MFKRILTALAVSVAALAPQISHAAFDKRVALVIGNGAYQNAPELANPVTDAKAMAASFERLGYEVVVGYDLDHAGLKRKIREFTLQSRDADLTTFFYAGHGISFESKNYLVPVDAAFTDATALDFEAIEVDFVMDQMKKSDGVALVFLDACRDNPLATTLSRSMGFSTRSAVSTGLTPVDISNAGKGVAIAFATSPGEVAYDGAGRHSPFTSALLSHLETPGQDITETMSRVTGDVLRSTEERQRPWLNASLTGPVVLNPAATELSFGEPVAPAPATLQTAALGVAPIQPALPSAPRATAPGGDVNAQIQLFNYARQEKDIAMYEAYINTYPTGIFVEAALKEMNELKSATPGAPVAGFVAPAAAAATAAAVATAPGQQLALASPAPGGVPAAGAVPAGPSPAALAVAGTDGTESAIGMNRSKRREVQTRLNLAGHNVGGADGIFGRNTRRGVTAWQASRGFPQTGFLTGAQLSELETQTASAYATHLANQPRRSTRTASRNTQRKATRSASTRRKAKTRRVTKRRATKRRVVRRRTVRRRNNGNAAAAAFTGAVIGGIIGGAISR